MAKWSPWSTLWLAAPVPKIVPPGGTIGVGQILSSADATTPEDITPAAPVAAAVPFEVVRLDIAGTYVEGSSYGAVAQLSLTF